MRFLLWPIKLVAAVVFYGVIAAVAIAFCSTGWGLFLVFMLVACHFQRKQQAKDRVHGTFHMCRECGARMNHKVQARTMCWSCGFINDTLPHVPTITGNIHRTLGTR